MKSNITFKRVYEYGGDCKADDTDYICGYQASNGVMIEKKYADGLNVYCWKVGESYYDTLNAAKNAVIRKASEAETTTAAQETASEPEAAQEQTEEAKARELRERAEGLCEEGKLHENFVRFVQKVEFQAYKAAAHESAVRLASKNPRVAAAMERLRAKRTANGESETDATEQAAADSEQEETNVMKEYWFFELGYFQERDCKTIKEEMDGKTFMNFEVVYSNCHGNCSLGVKTGYDGTEWKIKNFFLNCALGLIFELKHGAEEREKTRRQAEEFYRKRDAARQQDTQDSEPEATAGQPASQEAATPEDRIDALFHELVPVEGKADTVAGEIVRAVCRIGYRYSNDGDYVGYGYGKETCNPAARYLMANAGENVAGIVRCLWAAGEECGILDGGHYGDWLSELVRAALVYLDEHPELKTTPNAEDYWNYRDPDEDVDEWDDEDEDEWGAA